MRKIFPFIFLFLLLTRGCVSFTPASVETDDPDPRIVNPTVMISTNPAEKTKESSPEGWLLYENEEYDFYFYYPPRFEILTDNESLYGWDNGLALIYDGGQSYDIAIQVWDSAEEIEDFYGTEDERLHVFRVGDALISMMNITNEEDSEEIIASFSTR